MLKNYSTVPSRASLNYEMKLNETPNNPLFKIKYSFQCLYVYVLSFLSEMYNSSKIN